MLNKFDVNSLDILAELNWSAREGQLSTFKILLEKVLCMESLVAKSACDEALLRASEKGQKLVVVHLLQKGIFSDVGQFKAITTAKNKGHADLVDVLLENYTDQSKIWLIQALIIVLRDGKTDLAKEMLEESNATWRVWGVALREAVQNGQDEMVEYIIPDIEKIPEDYYRQAVAAAENNHPHLLPLLSRESEESRWVSKLFALGLLYFVVVVNFNDKPLSKRFI